jgi:hypothetical protein
VAALVPAHSHRPKHLKRPQKAATLALIFVINVTQKRASTIWVPLRRMLSNRIQQTSNSRPPPKSIFTSCESFGSAPLY